MRARLIAAAIALVTAVPAVAFADDLPRDGVDVASLTERPRKHPSAKEEADIDQRLDFLDKRIYAERLHAEIWWGASVSFYGAGALVQTARAMSSTVPADQADLWVSAVKATAGVVRNLAEPMKGIKGFKPIAGETKKARLTRGEHILRGNAKATTPFGPWYAHLINVGLNGVGAVIVGAGFGDWRTGLISAAIGTGVGEVSLLTQPWEADRDLDEYEARFGHGSSGGPRDVSWSIVPAAGGAGLNVSF